MIIYDTISADQIEDGDQILVNGEPVENVLVTNATALSVTVAGYSHWTGDRESYELLLDQLVDLWSV